MYEAKHTNANIYLGCVHVPLALWEKMQSPYLHQRDNCVDTARILTQRVPAEVNPHPGICNSECFAYMQNDHVD